MPEDQFDRVYGNAVCFDFTVTVFDLTSERVLNVWRVNVAEWTSNEMRNIRILQIYRITMTLILSSRQYFSLPIWHAVFIMQRGLKIDCNCIVSVDVSRSN